MKHKASCYLVFLPKFSIRSLNNKQQFLRYKCSICYVTDWLVSFNPSPPYVFCHIHVISYDVAFAKSFIALFIQSFWLVNHHNKSMTASMTIIPNESFFTMEGFSRCHFQCTLRVKDGNRVSLQEMNRVFTLMFAHYCSFRDTLMQPPDLKSITETSSTRNRKIC